jgi:hypothetical protein
MQGFGTPNEAIKAMDDGIANGRFKLCAHLGYTLSDSAFEAIRLYYPVCAKDCFIATDPWNQELGCPVGCRFYVNRETALAVQGEIRRLEERLERRRHFWRAVGTVLAAPFVYFRQFPPLVQSLVIILIILFTLPRLKDTIVEILKAVSGKP